ncbi:MAG: SWIM zinc finger family protein, partial [Planctomycetota bacterium]
VVDEPPDWVSEWLDSRDQRTEKKQQRAKEKSEKPVDVEAQKKRQAKREKNVAGGIEELDRFLIDLMRGGLAAAQSSGENECERVAARMVDAQAPGLARLVSELAGSLYGRGDWQQRSLQIVGRLRLITQAYRRIESLPELIREEVRAAVGFTQSTDELLLKEGVAGSWRVAGQVVEDDGRIKTQRTWLTEAETGRPAMVFTFAAGNRPLDSGLVVGRQFKGEVVYFPGSLGLRAIVKTKEDPGEIDNFTGLPCNQALDGYADALARCPWLERYPLAISGVVPVLDESSDDHRWLMVSEQGDPIPIAARFGEAWMLRAVSGDRPITVFGEWDGRVLLPLSAWANGQFVSLNQSEGAGLARMV